jgi:hypothetical protein
MLVRTEACHRAIKRGPVDVICAGPIRAIEHHFVRCTCKGRSEQRDQNDRTRERTYHHTRYQPTLDGNHILPDIAFVKQTLQQIWQLK